MATGRQTDRNGTFQKQNDDDITAAAERNNERPEEGQAADGVRGTDEAVLWH